MRWSPRVVATFFLSMLLLVTGIAISILLNQVELGILLSVLGIAIDISGIALGSYYEWHTSLTEDFVMALSKVFENRERRELVKILLRRADISLNEILQEFLDLGRKTDAARIYRHLHELQIVVNHYEDTNAGNGVRRYRLPERYEKFFRRHFEAL